MLRCVVGSNVNIRQTLSTLHVLCYTNTTKVLLEKLYAIMEMWTYYYIILREFVLPYLPGDRFA